MRRKYLTSLKKQRLRENFPPDLKIEKRREKENEKKVTYFLVTFLKYCVELLVFSAMNSQLIEIKVVDFILIFSSPTFLKNLENILQACV